MKIEIKQKHKVEKFLKNARQTRELAKIWKQVEEIKKREQYAKP